VTLGSSFGLGSSVDSGFLTILACVAGFLGSGLLSAFFFGFFLMVAVALLPPDPVVLLPPQTPANP